MKNKAKNNSCITETSHTRNTCVKATCMKLFFCFLFLHASQFSAHKLQVLICELINHHIGAYLNLFFSQYFTKRQEPLFVNCIDMNLSLSTGELFEIH